MRLVPADIITNEPKFEQDIESYLTQNNLPNDQKVKVFNQLITKYQQFVSRPPIPVVIHRRYS